MSSEEVFDRNRKYYLAVQYLIKLKDRGVINRVQLRKGNRYFAAKFEATMRLFV